MQVNDHKPVEPDLLVWLKQKRYCALVVKDGLRFVDIFAFCGSAILNQPVCIKQRVGITVKST